MRAKPKTKWNSPLNFRTMRKLSDLYSRIFRNIPELLIIQSSGCAPGVDYFRNFTNIPENFTTVSTQESGYPSGMDHFRT